MFTPSGLGDRVRNVLPAKRGGVGARTEQKDRQYREPGKQEEPKHRAAFSVVSAHRAEGVYGIFHGVLYNM